MPAALRGEGARGAPPAKKAPPARRTAPAPSGKIAGKLRAADGALPSHIALWAAGGVLILALGVVLATGHRAQRIVAGAERGVALRMAGYGFRVSKIQIAGASTMAQPDIAAAAAYVQSQPILGLDLAQLQHQVEAVGWVKSAQVIRLLPDTLMIKIVERDRMAVWQHDGQTFVVDKEGNVAPDANPALFPDLPLIVGQGAPQSAQAILDTLAAHPEVRSRAEALVRVDDRRWDLHMKSGALIQLPAQNPDAALLRLDQMQTRDQVLDLALDRIDLRDPDQTAVRLKSDAATPAPTPAATDPQGPA